MRVDTLTPTELNTNFGDTTTILTEKPPPRYTFLKSTRCKVLVIIGILLILGMIALFATTYTIALTATKKSTSSSTARTLTYQIITNSTDPIYAIYDATAGGSCLSSTSGYGVGNYPPGNGPDAAIDFADTTYLIFGTGMSGDGAGLITQPVVGASVVAAIKFQAGNDSADRDPLTITLEGSNNSGSSLYSGSAWTLLYNGPTGLASFSSPRLAWGDQQSITNTQSYTAYRMIVTSQRGADNCTEFAEMHLYSLA